MKALKINIISSIFLFLPLLISGEFLQAQTPVFPFDGLVDSLRHDNAIAKSTSLADASIAYKGTISSYNLNPALLSFVSSPFSIHLSAYQNWKNNNSHFDLILPIIKISDDIRSVVRFSYTSPNFGTLNPVGSINEPEPDLVQYQLETAFSYKFSNVFSTGILQKASFTNNENAQYWTYSAKAGLFYDPIGSLSYAAVIGGVGRSVKYRFIEDGSTILGSFNSPVSLDIGATFSFPEDSKDPNFSLSLSNEKRFGEDGVWYKGGMEIRPFNLLVFRSGLQFLPERDLYLPRFGLGIQTGEISIDYGISPGTQYKTRYHILGLTIKF